MSAASVIIAYSAMSLLIVLVTGAVWLGDRQPFLRDWALGMTAVLAGGVVVGLGTGSGGPDPTHPIILVALVACSCFLLRGVRRFQDRATSTAWYYVALLSVAWSTAGALMDLPPRLVALAPALVVAGCQGAAALTLLSGDLRSSRAAWMAALALALLGLHAIGLPVFRANVAYWTWSLALFPLLQLTLASGLLGAYYGRTQRETIALEARYRSIFDHAPEGMYQCTPGGQLVAVNPALARILGEAQPAAILDGRRFDDLFNDHAEGARIRGACEKRGRAAVPESSWRRRDGTTALVDIRAHRITDDSLGESFHLGFVRDVTHEQQLRAELLRAQKAEALGRLAGGVAHHVNNYLTFIRQGIELLDLEVQAGRGHDPLLDTTRQTAALAAKTTRKLLALSESQVLHPEPVELASLIDELVRTLLPVIAEDAPVRFELPDAPRLWVHADKAGIQQALLELLLGVRGIVPRCETTIRIGRIGRIGRAAGEPTGDGTEAAPSQQELALIELRCRGLTPDTIRTDEVFEPFYPNVTGRSWGSLDLASAKGFVTQSGGSTEAEADAQGMTLRVSLPLFDDPVQRRRRASRPSLTPQGRGGPDR